MRAPVEAIFKINSNAAANALQAQLAENPWLAARNGRTSGAGVEFGTATRFALEHMSEPHLRDDAVSPGCHPLLAETEKQIVDRKSGSLRYSQFFPEDASGTC